ncbi:MAG TPA: Xaa-Pro peptidase family protein [Symbiobacteriaceae bacterium]|nr:Xaa-Pro peptidase family protein [Symbiobacteriaceae bacterium]
MSTSRLLKLRSAMSERQVDGILICKPENRAYISGFTGSAGWLVISQEKAYLVTDFRYTEQAAMQAPAFEVVKVVTTIHPLVAELCTQLGITRLGFEGDFLTVDEFAQYQNALTGLDLVPVSGLVETIRMFKDAGEVEIMSRAAAITDQCWSQILPQIKPGVAERDLAVEMEYIMKKLGAEGLAFEIICASGVRSSLPHGRASEKVIEQGDLVTFDFGAAYGGYCSDMTRTVMVGEPSPKQREIYEIVLEAQLRGVAACKPGITDKELDAVCRSYITEKGYGENFGHGTGHGVGRFIHEGPRVGPLGKGVVLQPGMVVTIEPGIYLPGWGGVRIEDTVLVTEDGCRRLTQSPKDLLIL